MGRLLTKAGVDYGSSLAPAGARILDVLKQLAPTYVFDTTVTSARDGVHSGSADPHHSGEAFDVRSQGLSSADKATVLQDIRRLLYASTPRRFYAFLEDAGGPNEHFHIQRRAGTIYTVADYLANL